MNHGKKSRKVGLPAVTSIDGIREVQACTTHNVDLESSTTSNRYRRQRTHAGQEQNRLKRLRVFRVVPREII